MREVFHDGGVFLWPLLACAVAGLALVGWKFFSLRGTSALTRRLLDDVDDLVAAHRIEDVGIRCRDSEAPAASILLAGLKKRDQGAERVTAAIENEGLIQLSRLESGLPWLATIANVAPLIGFLGTVVGLIVVLGVLKSAGEVEPAVVAGRVGDTLIAAAAGLSIAIPLHVAHDWFVTKIDGLVMEMEESCQNLIASLEARVAHVPRDRG